MDEMMRQLNDRRQRAREAGQDAACAHLVGTECRTGLDEAIEAAIRVRVTPEVEAAYVAGAYGVHDQATAAIVPGLEAAFRAAGFEVEG